MSPATFFAPSSLRSKIVHRTPAEVSVRAVPSPNPDAPPVMTAEMPLRSMRRMLRDEAVAGNAVLRGGGLEGQEVDPVVHLVAGMPLDPGEADLSLGVEPQFQQGLPQVAVGDGLAGRVAPAPTPPALPPPVAEAIDDISRVAVDMHGAFDRLEGPQHGGDLHPLVGRPRI